ncbi:TPA: ATP-dependent nuclease subunit B [Streptococcus agalactiae]
MKLLYTDINHDMTEILVNQAAHAAEAGWRIFYIAPNSLSFEKERAVLENLPQEASFAITITRFAQLARYFTLNQPNQKESLNDIGLAMIFYRALASFEDGQLKVFGRLKQDASFISQLVDLYKELQTANLSILELKYLHSPEKFEDLLAIFLVVSDLLREGEYDNQSKIAFFTEQVRSGQLDVDLKNTILIVDGFTRFSAEEEALIKSLSSRCQEIIIGAYASQKAYKANFTNGNIYSAGVDFLRYLATTFQTKPEFILSKWESKSGFEMISKNIEGKHDFTNSSHILDDTAKDCITIWECINQKDEVEHVARAIRQKLYQGYRYKDILVLLGDVDSYKLQLSKIFEQYDIPYYFGKAETMAAHPLVHFMDSLSRIKRYRFRAEDVLNLFKTGIYGEISQDDLDYFEAYISYADIKGPKKFFTDFVVGAKKFDLGSLNTIRQSLLTPLESFVKTKKQDGIKTLNQFMFFLTQVGLSDNLSRLVGQMSENEQEKHQEVWKTFTDILEQFQTIFGQEKLNLDEFLSLLNSGMMQAEYRMVPATVDVVTVKSYDLVEPHSNQFVYALGMTQSHFPKIAQNKSLISDIERQLINDANDTDGHFDIMTQENLKKNHFAALSLFNAAKQELVLTIPQLLNESEDQMSPYLVELRDIGVPFNHKGRQSLKEEADNIGNYKALLSRVVDLYRSAIDKEMTKEEQTFWSVAVRYLRRQLTSKGIEIPIITDSLDTVTVSSDVMTRRFPEDDPLKLSSSALTTFYNNQYKYFLQYVLGLEEQDSIHPDMRHHGTYLHRVFEILMKNQGIESFEEKLNSAINKTNQEDVFKSLYSEDAESRYSLEILEDIARATATILRQDSQMTVESEEERFELMIDNTIKINGIIDRIDRLSDGSLGVVDYKSSAQKFDIQKFYNGLSPQLVTYIDAISRDKEVEQKPPIFGAMYLHMQEPRQDLSKIKNLDDLVTKNHQALTYKGLFSEAEKEFLANGKYHLKDSLYSETEIAILQAHNQSLYKKASETIKSGKFLINPYTEDAKTVDGDQFKSITGFEADRHMARARALYKLPAKEKRQGFLTLMQQEEENDDL